MRAAQFLKPRALQMRQIDFMRAHNNRCIKNIIACVTQSIKTLELDQSVCTLLLTNVKIFLQNDKNRFLRGQASEQKIAQKHGQNVIFSFCTEEKVDKKWAKPSHL